MLTASLTPSSRFFFFFNDTATTEIYTLSLHDALPIGPLLQFVPTQGLRLSHILRTHSRSEEHTSELQSRPQLVCRLLLEKKNKLPGGPEYGTKQPHIWGRMESGAGG